MKRLVIILALLTACVVGFAQDLPKEQFKGIKECLVKTHRILPNYDLHRTYMTTKSFYEFDENGRTKEITNYGGNDSYDGYYVYVYADTLDQRFYYSNHNIITERFVTRRLNDLGDTEKSLFSWGGKLINRVISNTNAEKHETIYNFYNDAGYPLYNDVHTKFPDGRIEKITTNDYDGFPVYYTYFKYNENKRLNSERKIDYADSLISVVEYDYDGEDRIITKSDISFSTNTSLINHYHYDILDRLSMTDIYEKSNKYGGEMIMIMKKEFIYDNYQEIDLKLYKGDEARYDRDKKVRERDKYELKQITKKKKKEDKAKLKADNRANREKSKLDREKAKIAKKRAEAEAKQKAEEDAKLKDTEENKDDVKVEDKKIDSPKE